MPSLDHSSLSPEPRRVVDLVSDYVRLQVRSGLDARSGTLEFLHAVTTVRASLSCLSLAMEISEQARTELQALLPDSSVLPASPETAAAALLEVASRLVSDDRSFLESPIDEEIPDHEFFRWGDLVQVQDNKHDLHGYQGHFRRYTDPRIGFRKRLAEVVLLGGDDKPIEVPPASLRFAPEDEGLDNNNLYRHLRTWQEDGFELRLYDTSRTTRSGKTILAYEFFDSRFDEGKQPVFQGEDFHPSLLHAVDADVVVSSVLSFFSLKAGDVESSYFDEYSERQLEWRDQHAEELSSWAWRLDERHQWRELHEAGHTVEAVQAVIRSSGNPLDLCDVLGIDIHAAEDLLDGLQLDERAPQVMLFRQQVLLERNRELLCLED